MFQEHKLGENGWIKRFDGQRDFVFQEHKVLAYA